MDGPITSSSLLNYRFILRGLTFIASLVALGFLFRASGLDAMLDQAWIDREVRGKGLEGELWFLVVGALATALGFPRQAVAFLGGYAFDLLLGTALALLASALGCVLAFYYARLFGRSLVSARFPGKVRRLDEFLGRHPFSMALLLRLLPVGHNLSTNLIAGVSSVSAARFVSGSAVGYLPQTLVFALAGSGVNLQPALRIGLAVALFVVSALLGVWLYRRFRQGTGLEAQLNEGLGEATEEPRS